MDSNRGNDPNKSQKPDGNQPRNNYFTPLMIALALVLVFSWVMNMVESSQYTQTTYSDFLEAKAAGQLALAAGCLGMVGGQILDMAGEERALTLAEVEELQRLKTGALITAALEMGWAVSGGTEEQREALRRYGAALGLAFQIQDDILDVVGDEAALGKPIGSDARSGKTTFVTLKGVDGCRALVARLTEQAAEALAPFGGEGAELRALAESLADRQT